MRIVSVGSHKQSHRPAITPVNLPQLREYLTQHSVNYLLVNGGDGLLRRVLRSLKELDRIPPVILDPTGSFNVIAKLHRVPPAQKILDRLEADELPQTRKQPLYRLNDEVFLFSAGNMGDLQHIFFSETLRFGILKKGAAKYLIALLLLLPAHLILTPFMLMSKSRFFIFTPLSFIKRFGSFRGVVDQPIEIDLGTSFNHLELDGDIVTIEEQLLHIAPDREIEIVVG